jgi:hypothetical protein
MAKNPYFNNHGYSPTQNLYESLVIEAIKIYGHDFFYVPRQFSRIDRIFGEDVASSFLESYEVEMYVENSQGYDGQELFQKFGVDIRDEAVFVVSQKRWREAVRDVASIDLKRPREGDLIYVPFSKSLFEITFVEHEAPFYQLGNLPVYKISVSLFVYNDEAIDIDDSGFTGSSLSATQVITLSAPVAFLAGETLTQEAGSVTISGEVVSVDGNQVTVRNVSSVGGFRLFGAGTIEGSASLLTGTIGSVEIFDDPLAENDEIQIRSDQIVVFDPNSPFGDY